jgi:hypothetical protein
MTMTGDQDNNTADVNVVVKPQAANQRAPRRQRRAFKRGEGRLTTTPYANAISGMRAREEIKKVLLHFGCESIGFIDEFERQEVLLALTHRGRQVQLRASAKGWAQMWLKANPWTYKHRTPRAEYEQNALKQGHIAVNSILRDWIKGQMAAVECGILSFEAVFFPYMLTNDGRPLIERVADLLPQADEQKVVALPTR